MNTRKTIPIEDHYRVTCKCESCGRTQAVKISTLVAGEVHCRIGLTRNPCNGTLNYYTDDPDEATANALNVLGYLNWTKFKGDTSPLAELVDTVVDDVGNWQDSHATPQEMGWVGQNGLP